MLLRKPEKTAFCKPFTFSVCLSRACLTTTLAALLMIVTPAQAEQPQRYQPGERVKEPAKPLTISGDLIGKMGMTTTTYEDTFADIGDRNSLGYLELVYANPGIDPWLPGDDTRITLPTEYVLPDAPREGIIINLAEFRLYYFHDGKVTTYPVGVGSEQNPSPLVQTRVTMRLESPAWYPPDSVRAEYAEDGEELPRVIPPGPENPLGNYALKLSEAGYLIHGTNKRFGIGMQISHGCIRMYNDDIAQLIYAVPKGTSVLFVDQPVKVGLKGNDVWLEVHRRQDTVDEQTHDRLWRDVMKRMDALLENHPDIEFQRKAVEMAVERADGVPRLVGERVNHIARAEQEKSRH